MLSISTTVRSMVDGQTVKFIQARMEGAWIVVLRVLAGRECPIEFECRSSLCEHFGCSVRAIAWPALLNAEAWGGSHC